MSAENIPSEMSARSHETENTPIDDSDKYIIIYDEHDYHVKKLAATLPKAPDSDDDDNNPRIPVILKGPQIDWAHWILMRIKSLMESELIPPQPQILQQRPQPPSIIQRSYPPQPSCSTIQKVCSTAGKPECRSNKTAVPVWSTEGKNVANFEGSRPNLGYPILCILACLNSPDKKCLPKEVYNFILHHWPYYRFVTKDNWRNSVRKALSNELHFNAERHPLKNESSYSIKPNANLLFTVGGTRSELMAISRDPRGVEFYTKMIRGEIGLPRKFFYDVIGSHARQFAGPENSAMFYHLLSIGHIPEWPNELFSIHYGMMSSGKEPIFGREDVEFNGNTILKVTKMPKVYKINESDIGNVSIDEEFFNEFYGSIDRYFEIQKTMKSEGCANWEAPLWPLNRNY